MKKLILTLSALAVSTSLSSLTFAAALTFSQNGPTSRVHVSATSLGELQSELLSHGFEIRLNSGALASSVLAGSATGPTRATALRTFLQDRLNFVGIPDDKGGREILLVGSIGDRIPSDASATSAAASTSLVQAPARSAAASGVAASFRDESKKVVAIAAPYVRPSTVPAARARSLEEWQPVRPADVSSREGSIPSGDQVKAELARVAADEAQRAVNAVNSGDISLRNQGIQYLAQSNSPSASTALGTFAAQIPASASIQSPEAVVAFAGRHLDAINYDAGRTETLLASLASSDNAAVRQASAELRARYDNWRGRNGK